MALPSPCHLARSCQNAALLTFDPKNLARHPMLPGMIVPLSCTLKSCPRDLERHPVLQSTTMPPLFTIFLPVLLQHARASPPFSSFTFLSTITNEGNPSHFLNIPLEQTHEIGRANVKLQEQMRMLTQKVAQVKESTP